MDSEFKRVLDETHALAKDNHRMLKAIRRDQWIGFFSKIIVWAIVVVLPFYLYQQYLSPLITQFSTLPGMTASSSNLFGLPTTAELQKLINSFKVGQ